MISKPTICIGENKGTDQLCSNCTADQRLCFHCRDSTISQLSHFPKFEISSYHLLWLHSLICVRSGRNQNVGFSHVKAQLFLGSSLVVSGSGHGNLEFHFSPQKKIEKGHKCLESEKHLDKKVPTDTSCVLEQDTFTAHSTV